MSHFAALASKIHSARRKFRLTRHGALPLEFFQKLGLKYLGGGSFGSASLHTVSGRVLKVGHTTTDGSMGFIGIVAEYCRKHGRAPKYCPMVWEFAVCEGYWYAVMEQVTTTYARENRLWSERERDAIESKRAIHALCGELVQEASDWREYTTYKPGNTPDAGWDMHAHNCGTTADGRYVVFDPFYTALRPAKYPRQVRQKIQHGPAQGRWH